MEKRKFKRFPTNLTGVIIIDGRSCVGQLKDISEEGVGYLSMLHVYYYHKGIIPEKKVKLYINETSDNNAIDLDCEIRWTNCLSDPSQPFLGLKVLNPPDTYKNLVKTLVSM